MSKNNYINIALISGAGVLGGLINYIYHPIMLRFLSLEDFGAFGSLVGIFNILGILVTGFDLFLNKSFSENLKNKDRVKFIYTNSLKIFSLIGMTTFLFYLTCSFFIADFLKIDSVFLVILAGFSMITSFLGISNTSFLKSSKYFSFLSFLSILNPIFKLVLGVGLVYLGFGIFGALAGFIVSGLLGVLLGFYYISKKLKNYKNNGKLKDLLKNFYTNKKEIINFFILSFLFANFMYLDVILARNIFPEKISGIYAGIGVLGKFLIFLLLSVETVYFGQIMQYKREDLPFHLIKNPIIIISFLSFSAIITNYFVGSFILKLLKEELASYVNIYLWNLVFYGFLSFISFFVKILIGWKKYYINYILALLLLLLFVLVYTFGKTSLLTFIQSFVLVGFIGFLTFGGIFFIEYKKK